MKDVLRTKKCLNLYITKRKKLGKDIYNTDLTTLKSIKKWKYWILVKNEFPYDQITSKHDLLVPLRKFSKDCQMEDIELHELWDIKMELDKKYDCFLENTLGRRSIVSQFHLHCIKFIYTTPLKKLI